jgi:hypothetical protein
MDMFFIRLAVCVRVWRWGCLNFCGMQSNGKNPYKSILVDIGLVSMKINLY